jgi:ATP-dependent DNA ligase
MLLRPGSIPSDVGSAFELKYDGFRAIVSTEHGLQVCSRRA